MKKLILSSSVIFAFIFYTLSHQTGGSTLTNIASTTIAETKLPEAAPQNTKPKTVATEPPPAKKPASIPRVIFGDDEEFDGGGPVTPVQTTPTPSQPAPQPTPTLPPAPTPPPAGGPAPAPQPTGKYRNGTYTGPVADAYYGNIQVQAVIQGGKITDVLFLDYPHDRSRSIAINTQAMPYLKSEAIQAQSASVDIVSGATATSGAFIESLTAALAQALL